MDGRWGRGDVVYIMLKKEEVTAPGRHHRYLAADRDS